MSSLYKYQKIGVLQIERFKGNALLADEPGLGKTVQGLSYAYRNKEETIPAVIVCPSSLKENWEAEINKWTNFTCKIVYGQTPYTFKRVDIVIINYSILIYWWKWLYKTGFKLIIFDEAHYLKGRLTEKKTSKVFEAAKNLRSVIPHCVAITGTPIENKPKDLFNILNILRPDLFPNFKMYANTFCKSKDSNSYSKWNGASNEALLHRLLIKHVMIRRTKKQVAKFLPKQRICKVVLHLSNRKEYDKANNEFITYIKDKFDKDIEMISSKLDAEISAFEKAENIKIKKSLTEREKSRLKKEKVKKIRKAETLVKIELLKQLAAKGKLNDFIEWVENFLMNEKKIVIFAINKVAVQAIYEHFKNIAVKIDGSVPTKKRHGIVKEFQTNPKVKVFVGNMRAAGEGLTLTAASDVCIFQFPWNPTQETQAKDRVHRISQTEDVTIWRFVGKNTIEEKIIDLLQEKQEIINRVIDGKKRGAKEIEVKDIFNELIQNIIKTNLN